MTEAEALDEAAKAAGWLDGWDFMTAEGGLMFAQSIRAHAKTIVAMAELMTTCEEATTLMELMYLEHRKVVDENAALKAENERLREALELADAALRGANMNMNVVERKVRAALKEIGHGDR